MGLLMGALGGAAEVGLSQMEDQRKSDVLEGRSQRMAEFESKLATQRAEAVEKTKEQFRRSEQVRLEQEGQAAAEGGREIRSKREIDTATKRAPSVNADAMGLIRSSLSDADVEKYYGVKAPTAVSEYDDQITSARQSGHYDTVKGLRDGRKDEMEVVKLDQAREIADQKDRTTRERDEARHKELMAKGSGGGGDGKGPAFVETYKFLEGKGYTKSAIEDILTDKKGKSVEDIAIDLINKDPKVGRRDALTPEQAIEKARQIKSIVSGSTEKPTASTKNEGKSTIPKGMTPAQVITEARIAIKNGKDPAVIKARLQAMGLSL